MLSTPGIGSGLDVDTIITQLLEVEQFPLVRLEARKAENGVKISSYGQISSDLSALQSTIQTLADPDTFSQFTATSSNEGVFTASADGNAANETHSVNVINLAVNQRLNSQSFADQDTVVGAGTLTLSSSSNSFELTVDANNNTLGGVRDSINAAEGNTSITASIINVDGGSRLILTANNTGLANQMEVIISNDGDGDDLNNAGLSQLLFQQGGTSYLTELQEAGDAEVQVDGFTVNSASNQISDVISGVTLTLTGQGTAELGVEADYSGVSTVMDDLVNNYNSILGTINGLRETTLSGDNFLLGLERQLRETFSSQIGGSEANLNTILDLGLSFDNDGILSFDSTILNAELASDPEVVATLFTTEQTGFAEITDSVIAGYLGSTGLIEGRTSSLGDNNDFLDERIIQLNERLLRTEERLLQQFTALDTLIAQLSVTSNFLDQQLSSLNFNQG